MIGWNSAGDRVEFSGDKINIIKMTLIIHVFITIQATLRPYCCDMFVQHKEAANGTAFKPGARC